MCDVDVSDTVTMATTSIPTSVSDPVMSTSKGDPASDNSTLADALSRLVLKREKPRLPTFSGRDTTKRETTFFDWMYVVKKVIKQREQYNLTEREFGDVIFQSLNGEARSRYIRLEDTNSNLTDILEAMSAVYKDSTPSIDRIQTLHTSKQNKGESVTQFADRLENTAFWAERANDVMPFNRDLTLKMVFLKGLSNRRFADIMEHLKDDASKTYDQIRAKAISLERERTETDPKKLIQPVQSDLQDKVDRLTKQVESLQAALNAGKGAEPKRQKRPYQRLTCDYCKRNGHTEMFCYKRRDDLRNSQTTSTRPLN